MQMNFISSKKQPVFARNIRLPAFCAALAAVVAMSAAQAVEFTPYPGTYPAKVMTVETASRVVVEVPVWTGFVRTFKITVPGIVVPRDDRKAPRCERALAKQAKQFTESFLAQTTKVQARDIRMEDSGKEDAKADVHTDMGSLADALIKNGFARPEGSPAEPWCNAR